MWFKWQPRELLNEINEEAFSSSKAALTKSGAEILSRERICRDEPRPIAPTSSAPARRSLDNSIKNKFTRISLVSQLQLDFKAFQHCQLKGISYGLVSSIQLWCYRDAK